MAVELEKIIFEDLPSTNTPINATNLNKMQSNIENAINSGGSVSDTLEVQDTTKIAPSIRLTEKIINDGYEYGEWTPNLANLSENSTPTVSYSNQTGTYVKIPIKGTEKSLVYYTLSIKGIISGTSGNNYAAIKGLPFVPATSGLEACNFTSFYKGINDSHPIPTGKIRSGAIGIYNATTSSRGGVVETWVTNTTACEIQGNGLYITNE